MAVWGRKKLETKAFLKNIEAMVERAFDTLRVRCPHFELYTVLIHIDFKTPKKAKSKAVCSIGFDDLQNSLKHAKIWADSLHTKDEADRSKTRTYNPRNVLLSEVETIECDDLEIKDAVSTLKKRPLALDIAVHVRAQELNIHKNAELIVEFEQWYFGRSILGIINPTNAGKK